MAKRKSANWWVRQMHDNWADCYDPAIEVSTRIYRLHELLREKIEIVLRRYSLLPAEFEALATLRIVDPPHELTPTDVHRTILLSTGGTTKVIKRLETAGLVSITVSPKDGRSRLIRLTKKGKKVVEAAMRDAIDAEMEVLGQAFNENGRSRLGKQLSNALKRLEGE